MLEAEVGHQHPTADQTSPLHQTSAFPQPSTVSGVADRREVNCLMALVKHPGISTALGAAILFGASAPIAKLLLEGAAPQLLAGLFYLGSGIGLGIVWLRRRRSADVASESSLTRRD